MTKSPEPLTEVHGASPRRTSRGAAPGCPRPGPCSSFRLGRHLQASLPGGLGQHPAHRNSGTGKTTMMNNIQRLYDSLAGVRGTPASVTILNANLLVDSDRTEFRPDRMFAAVEQRARIILGEEASPARSRRRWSGRRSASTKSTRCPTVIAGKPNRSRGAQQGLLTLMEGERSALPPPTSWEGERERELHGRDRHPQA